MVHVYDLQGGQWVTGFQAAAGMSLLNLCFQRRFNAVFGCEPGKRCLAQVAPQAVDFQAWWLDRPAWASAPRPVSQPHTP